LAAAEERAAAAAAALLEEEESTAAAKATSTKKKKQKKGKRKGGGAAATQEQGPISALEASNTSDDTQVRLKYSTSAMSRSCRYNRRLGYGSFVKSWDTRLCCT
jgi:hypothetical protein